MNEVVKSVGMYALTGVAAWVASRYHLNGEQTAAVMSDLVMLVSAGTGVVMHYTAFKTVPPK